ncbi:MAG: hypothetical protein J5852_06500 [Clostridia bacterium]|nr:hypothetical protein [Clostridia bacterium]
MKKTVKIAFCGIIAALITGVMAASLIPDLTFSVPAIAGLFIIPVFAEAGYAYALLCFFASSALSFFIGDKTSFVLYIALFGYYPILKPLIEKIKVSLVKWLLKLFLFNTAAVVCYLVEILLFTVTLKGWMLAVSFLLGNIAFVLYDIAVSRIAALYYLKLHNRISSMLKR